MELEQFIAGTVEAISLQLLVKIKLSSSNVFFVNSTNLMVINGSQVVAGVVYLLSKYDIIMC